MNEGKGYCCVHSTEFGGAPVADLPRRLLPHSKGRSPPIITGSVSAADYDNDGDVDLLLVGFEREYAHQLPSTLSSLRSSRPPTLLENLSGRRWRDLTKQAGLTPPLAGLAEAVAHGDLDADGWMDAIVTNGALMRGAWSSAIKHTNKGYPQLFRNRLWRLHNETRPNGWLQVQLRDAGGGDAVGTLLTLIGTNRSKGEVVQLRCQCGGAHSVAQDEQLVHFGTGKLEVLELHVLWLSGRRHGFSNLAPNQRLWLDERQGLLRRE